MDTDFVESNNPKYPTLEPRQPFHQFPWTLPLRSMKMELEESVSEDVGADLNEGFDTFIEKKGMLVSQILQP